MHQEDGKTERLFSEACEWLGRIEDGAPEDLMAFDQWLCESAQHVQQVIELQALICESRRALRQDPRHSRSRKPSAKVLPLIIRRRAK